MVQKACGLEISHPLHQAFEEHSTELFKNVVPEETFKQIFEVLGCVEQYGLKLFYIGCFGK